MIVLLLAAHAAIVNAQRPGSGSAVAGDIVLGHTVAYSGPAAAFGQAGRAMTAYFRKVNAEGGIRGRKIRFLSRDDGYMPAKALEEVRHLVEHDGILASVGNLGTQSNLAIYRYLNERRIPHLFVVSGLERWNDPRLGPWTIGFIPTYYTEGRIYAQHIQATVVRPRIAILYQKDDAGREGVRGLRDGLVTASPSLIVAEATYEVTDPTVDSQIANLAASGANVFVNASAPRPAAQAIRKMRDIGWRPLHVLFSPSANIAATLLPAGLESAAGIVSAAYFKDPGDPGWDGDAGRDDWRGWMARYLPEASPVDPYNVLGYSVAQLVVHVLRQCGDDLSRDNIAQQAFRLKDVQLPMLLPGITITTSRDDRRVIRGMRMQRFDGSKWQLMGPLITEPQPH